MNGQTVTGQARNGASPPCGQYGRDSFDKIVGEAVIMLNFALANGYTNSKNYEVTTDVIVPIRKAEEIVRNGDNPAPSLEIIQAFDLAFNKLSRTLAPVTARTILATSKEPECLRKSRWCLNVPMNEAAIWSVTLWLILTGLVFFIFVFTHVSDTMKDGGKASGTSTALKTGATDQAPAEGSVTQGASQGVTGTESQPGKPASSSSSGDAGSARKTGDAQPSIASNNATSGNTGSKTASSLLLFLFGGLGACTYLLKSCYKYMTERCFDPNFKPEYFIRLGLGVVAGGSLMIFDNLFRENFRGLGANATAFLLGYSSDLLFDTLERVTAAFFRKSEAESGATSNTASTANPPNSAAPTH